MSRYSDYWGDLETEVDYGIRVQYINDAIHQHLDQAIVNHHTLDSVLGRRRYLQVDDQG